MGPELYGVKWRHLQLALTVRKYLTDPSRGEDQAVILPENSGQQPIVSLAVKMLTERPHS
jgi:hypothetical protein